MRASTVRRSALLLVLLAACLPCASAQSVRLGLGLLAGEAASPSFGVRFEGVRVPSGTVTLDLGLAELPRLGFGFTTSRAFGPLGNVVVEAWGAMRVGGKAEARVGARGVLGPVALRLTLLGFGAEPAAFRPDALTSTERPLLPTEAFGVQLGLTTRLSRDVVLEVDPELYLADGVALRAEARLRLLRSLGENELGVLAYVYAPPGFGAAGAAVGLGITLPRGRAPDWSFAALLGVSPSGVAVGGRASLAEDFGSFRLGLDAAYEPYRLDVAPARVTARATAPAAAALGGGSWELSAQLASDLGASVPQRAAAGTAFAVTVALLLPYR